MINVSYKNNRGSSLNLNTDPYWLYYEPILDYEWRYATKDRKRGSIVAGFSKDIVETELNLAIWGLTEQERNTAIDEFNNLVETDIYDGIAGTLTVGDWFTYGYIIASENTDWDKGAPIVRKKVKLVREQLSWYRKMRVANYGERATEGFVNIIEADVKDYEQSFLGYSGYNYSYDYRQDLVSQKQVSNPSAFDSEFIVNIQGPATNPEIQIGDTVVSVLVEIPNGAVLTVDSTKKTAIITTSDGEEINCFGARDPQYYLFQRVPAGRNTISWNGAFLWELILIEERSEPRWLMD